MNRLMALIAFATLAGYVGILAWFVPSLDLVLVVTLTIVLVAIDFIKSSRQKRN